MRRFGSSHSEAALRSAERRKRSEDAPRLLAQVPELKTLCLHIEERRDGHKIAESAHIRHFVLPRAPALFELPCHDPYCKEGGHDPTDEILRHLRQGREQFEGEERCRGSVGTSECQRVLHYNALATYKSK